MQKKIYIGGLPWEIDRVGLLNYMKAILECNGIEASYELPFVSNMTPNANSTTRVVDVFVAMDRETNKSRGFGFVTVDVENEEMFNKVIELLQNRTMIGIRGGRQLIVNEAEAKQEAPRRDNAESAPVADAEPTVGDEESVF